VQYVHRNETTKCLKIVHCYRPGRPDAIPERLEACCRALDELYPKITIDLELVEAEFSPRAVAALSRRLGIPVSLMFLACPGPDFPYSIGDFGGVRIIML